MDYILNNVGTINLNKLQNELLSYPVVGLSINSTNLIIHASEELTGTQLSEIENIALSHDPIDMAEIIKQTIGDAMNFGNNLILEFAAENVLLGITQAGKTKAVADYLADVTRYAQTGSLYEVLNEIHRLESLGLPQNLEPFVTQARINLFKQKILDYLT
jgi:hypothetical protein